MTMRLMSPRSTAPYQTLDSSASVTSPTTVAPGTIHALEWIVGPFFKRAAIPECPVGCESRSICISMFDVRCSMFHLQPLNSFSTDLNAASQAACDQRGRMSAFARPGRGRRLRRENGIFFLWRMDDYSGLMPEIPTEGVTPFVFSDPTGKRWPRLRLILLIAGVLFFLGTVLFVQTLFVAPQMSVPFSLRQLKGQLKALQKENPAGQLSASSLLWQKFGAARQAAKKLGGTARTPPPRPRKQSTNNEVRLALYTNRDPYSWASLEQHAAEITHLCSEWMTVINGMGDLQIDADGRLPKFAANKGIALMPLLTNLVGDTWQPEAIENLAHGPGERQDRFIQRVLSVLRSAKASGVVVDWEPNDQA